MVAEWRGFSIYSTKLPLAFGLLFKSYGYMALASFVAYSLLIGFFDGLEILSSFWTALVGSGPWPRDNYLRVLILVSLPTLPIGWALCTFVLRKKKQVG